MEGKEDVISTIEMGQKETLIDPYSIVSRAFAWNTTPLSTGLQLRERNSREDDGDDDDSEESESHFSVLSWYFLIEAARAVYREQYDCFVPLEGHVPYRTFEKRWGEDVLTVLLAAHFPLDHSPPQHDIQIQSQGHQQYQPQQQQQQQPQQKRQQRQEPIKESDDLSFSHWQDWGDRGEYGLTMESFAPYAFSPYQHTWQHRYHLKLRRPVTETCRQQWIEEAQRLLASVKGHLIGCQQHPYISSRLILLEEDRSTWWDLIMTDDATALWPSALYREGAPEAPSLFHVWDRFVRTQQVNPDDILVFKHKQGWPALLELAKHHIHWQPSRSHSSIS